MIAQNDHSLRRSVLTIKIAEVETCNMILFPPPPLLPLLGYQFSNYGSRDQPRPWSFLHKREEPGNEFL
jgi:hypothetical protein